MSGHLGMPAPRSGGPKHESERTEAHALNLQKNQTPPAVLARSTEVTRVVRQLWPIRQRADAVRGPVPGGLFVVGLFGLEHRFQSPNQLLQLLHRLVDFNLSLHLSTTSLFVSPYEGIRLIVSSKTAMAMPGLTRIRGRAWGKTRPLATEPVSYCWKGTSRKRAPHPMAGIGSHVTQAGRCPVRPVLHFETGRGSPPNSSGDPPQAKTPINPSTFDIRHSKLRPSGFPCPGSGPSGVGLGRLTRGALDRRPEDHPGVADAPRPCAPRPAPYPDTTRPLPRPSASQKPQ